MSYLPAAYRPALGATDVPMNAPEPGKPQPPIYPLQVGDHGGFLEVRSSPADGACGVGTYPCRHPGVDVVGMAGTPVVAPENGTVVATADGNGAPFGGYGPWLVLIAGDSGKYHLLGHLDPSTSSMASVGQTVTAGQTVGTTSSANHTHWEVRAKPTPDFAAGETNFDNNSSPLTWLTVSKIGLGLLVLGAGAVIALAFYLRSRR